MRSLMSRKSLIALLIAMLISEAARAELQGIPPASPVFNREEAAIIGRNTVLAQAVKVDPWMVRDLLDSVKNPIASQSGADDTTKKAPPPDPIDTTENPDLPQMQSISPEAVNDLFQLLKLAGAKRSDKAK
jgi:hypothetical protein